MASSGQIKFAKVLKMLARCAPGYEIKDKLHKKWVTYKGKRATLPKGPGAKNTRFDIELGHVKALVRQFLIAECAQEILPQLKTKKSKSSTR